MITDYRITTKICTLRTVYENLYWVSKSFVLLFNLQALYFSKTLG